MITFSFTVEPDPAPTSSALAFSRPDEPGVKTFALDVGGRLELPARLLVGPDAIAQRLAVRLRHVKGDWFADLRYGVPLFEHVLGKPREVPIVDTVFRREIIRCPGVLELQAYKSSLDRATRTYSAEFVARVEGAALVNGSLAA